jgi:prepilin-type processing-associated H-X9-DG protein
LLTADAKTIKGSSPLSADGLLFSQQDIACRHDSGFVATFLDGHVYIRLGTQGKILTNATDATAAPIAQTGSDFCFQGADHLFVIDGQRGKVSGKNFTSKDVGRPYYFSFYYAAVPVKGQGITIYAPGGPVTLITPTKGKYYAIYVRPCDVRHKITASLHGTTLTIRNDG